MFFSFKSAVALIFSMIFAAINSLSNFAGVRNRQIKPAPEDFTPVVRFVVCSDVHIEGADDQETINRYIDFIETSYAYSNSNTVYKGLDAICVCGDFTGRGTKEEYEAFTAVNEQYVREGTQLITVLGNHEFMDDSSQAIERYESYMGTPKNTSYTINGFHFIGVSYNENKTFTGADTKGWLEAELKAAKQDAPNYPIFVFQHPHPFGTVYGSVNWGNFITSTVYNKYAQVINFSGHSHYPINDPRSVWQGSFTALGCGTLKYFELENELYAGQFPEGNGNAAQFYIVEADANGSVRILGYDLITHSFFDSVDYYIEKPADKSTFTYTYKGRMDATKAPQFDADAQINVTNGEGGCTVSFPAAKSDTVVHDYKITVKSGLNTVYSGSVLSDYYYLPAKDSCLFNLGELALEPGSKYTVTVVAGDCFYRMSSPITCEFTA